MAERRKNENYMQDDLSLTLINKNRYTVNKNLALQIESTHCGPFKIYQRKNTKQRHTDENDSEMQPTNAFGQMEFIGGESKTRAKYIRLSDKTDFREIEALMEKSWDLKCWPKIVISVIGGVRNFKIKPQITRHLKKEIHKLCLKVADMPTETWIITKGTDYGVTKLVAEGMQGNKYKNTSVIGVTLWEKLKGKNDLKQPKNSIKIPRYSVKKETKQVTDEEYYLNKDHTHFFLVDTPENDENCTEKEIVFRHQLVRHIIFRQLKELGSTEIKFGPEEIFVPAIQLVINGGLRTLSQIKQNLYPEDGGTQPVIMPVVVVAETGRVADWLTFAVEHEITMLNELPDKIKKISPQNYTQIFNDINLCLQRKQFITIYHPFQSKSLEDTIVRTFTKTRRLRNDSYIAFDQLKMTMRWGREDIAEEEFVKVMSDKKVEYPRIIGVMKELLLGALRKQEMSFFNMILRICFDIRTFDKHMLMSLYKQVYLKDKDKHKNVLFTFLNPPKAFMMDLEVNPLTKRIMRTNEIDILNDIRKEINKLLSIKVVDYYREETFEVSDPEKELFLWAILCNKQKVAIALWKHGDDPIAKALIARKMYNKMASRYKTIHPFFDDHVYKSLQKHASYFECEALNLLEKCSLVSSSRAAQLMDVKMPRWMDKSCMDLAALSDFEQFVAHQRCQDITDLTWRGDFALYGRYLNVKIISGVIFPPIILLLKFKDTYRHKEKFCCSATSSTKKFVCMTRSIVDKFYAFYDAPVTKFWRNAIFYIFFLLCFCYILLNNLRSKILFAEYIVMTFIVAFGMDELRSIIQAPGNNFNQKVHAWWTDLWNKIDCMALLLFPIAFTLRHFDGPHSVSHFSYALDFLLWTIRLLQVISLHEKIGVYIVMLQRMMGDVIYFVAILLVFVLGYGIARTSILYPEIELKLDQEQDLGKKIFLKAFFHVMGEMFLNTEISNQNNETIFQTTLHDTHSEGFMVMLQFCYILITNLLYINLLIAVFNNTYTVVQEHSDRIWKWNYYQMVKEYQAGSILPAPLSILSNIIFFSKAILKRIMKRTLKKQHKGERVSRHFNEFISMTEYFEKDTHLNTMKQFENECLSKYIIERNEYIQRKFHVKSSLSGPNKDSPNAEHTICQPKELDAGLILYGSDDENY